MYTQAKQQRRLKEANEEEEEDDDDEKKTSDQIILSRNRIRLDPAKKQRNENNAMKFAQIKAHTPSTPYAHSN